MNQTLEVRVPDIGDFKDVPVLEVLVTPGSRVEADTPLLTLESDKATIDVPAPFSGVIKDIALRAGQRVSQGALILTMLAQQGEAAPEQPAIPATAAAAPASTPAPTP